MWFKKKKKVQNTEVLPAVHFYLIEGDKIRINVEWPEQNFSPTAFGNLLSRIVEGIPPLYLEKPIQTFIEQSSNPTIKQVGFTFIEKLKQTHKVKAVIHSDSPLISPDKVTHHHFTQSNISIQGGD